MPTNNENISLIAVGDIMLGRKETAPAENSSLNYIFKEVIPFFEKADIRFGNLEMPLTDYNIRNPEKPGDYPVLKGKKFFANVLKEAGFDILSLANNHIMDYSEKGLFETIKVLKEKNIHYLGVGANENESRNPVIIKKEIKLGFLGYSCSYMASKNGPGCASVYKHKQIIKDVQKLKGDVDHVIVSLHRGLEFSDYPTLAQRKEALALIDAGASLILGHHPHVLQGIEEYKNGVICHSLGNFVFDFGNSEIYRKALDNCLISKKGMQIFDNNDDRGNESVIFSCVFTKNNIKRYNIVPILINDKCQPEPAKGGKKNQILKRMDYLSANLKNEKFPFLQKLDEIDISENIESAFKYNLPLIILKLQKIRIRHLTLLYKYIKSKIVRILVSFKFSKLFTNLK